MGPHGVRLCQKGVLLMYGQCGDKIEGVELYGAAWGKGVYMQWVWHLPK